MSNVSVNRLMPGDRAKARELFSLMAEVFEEESTSLSDRYLDELLTTTTFWAIAAFSGGHVVGGLTAHALPMTKTEAREIFIFDVAVRKDHQRRGIGRQLIAVLRELATETGIQTIFVAADNEDGHALDFYRALGGEATQATLFVLNKSLQIV